MHSKKQDLQMVFAGATIEGLKMLRRGVVSRSVICGRFVDLNGDGCLLFLLSERRIVCRQTLDEWISERLFYIPGACEACKRLIVGWDARHPSKISKGEGYDSFYPKASYTLGAEEVIAAIDEALALRSSANASEERSLERIAVPV